MRLILGVDPFALDPAVGGPSKQFLLRRRATKAAGVDLEDGFRPGSYSE
ncbi:MAG: hypothetical protein JO372_12410 [Solirubrobacterales bacterium]|nr:hypothetical protein [Solirubrobacterales bacterium]